MEAPFCYVCQSRHWSTQPHIVRPGLLDTTLPTPPTGTSDQPDPGAQSVLAEKIEPAKQADTEQADSPASEADKEPAKPPRVKLNERERAKQQYERTAARLAKYRKPKPEIK